MKRTKSNPVGSLMSETDHYLKQELYDLIKKDDDIFDFLQESSLDGLWFWDLENPDDEWMNAQFWTTLGYNPDRMPHKASAWQNIINKDDLIDVHQNFLKHLEDPSSPYDQIVRYKHKKGHTIWIRCRGKVFRNNLGKPIRMLGAHTDITEIKQREEELKIQSAFFEQVINGTDLATWKWNVQTGETIFNERWANIIGYELEDLEPTSIETWKNLAHTDDQDRVLGLLEQHFQGDEEFFESESRLKHRNGDYVWVLAKGKVVTWDENGNPEWMVGSHQEITKRKQEYNRIKLFVEEAPAALAMFDTAINYVSASKEWLRFFNIQHAVVKGRSQAEVLLNVPKNWEVNYKKCLQGNVLKEIEEKIVKADKTVQWLSWNFQPWYGEKGKIKGVIVGVTDITKIKREKELQSLLDVTRAQNDRLKNFAHIVSHNLKSHTGNFEMLLSLLDEEMPELKENNIVQMLIKASKDLSDTIIDLNEVVSINTKLNNHLKKIELKKTIDAVLRSLQATIEESGVSVVNEVENHITVKGIAAYLESIILNLVSNGIKYKADKIDSYVKLSSYIADEYVVLKVADNGLGIDLRRYGAKVFGLYKTFHPKVKTARGVGLFITKNQIEAMEGKIEVESEAGEGTIFKVFFKH